MSTLVEHALITDDCCSCTLCAEDRAWNAAIEACIEAAWLHSKFGLGTSVAQFPTLLAKLKR